MNESCTVSSHAILSSHIQQPHKMLQFSYAHNAELTLGNLLYYESDAIKNQINTITNETNEESGVLSGTKDINELRSELKMLLSVGTSRISHLNELDEELKSLKDEEAKLESTIQTLNSSTKSNITCSKDIEVLTHTLNRKNHQFLSWMLLY